MTGSRLNDFDLGLYSRRPREKFTQARVIRALQRAAQQQSGVALGVTKRAARRLSCAESTVRSYIKKYPLVAAAKLEIEAAWQARVDEMLAEIKARQSGRKSSFDPGRLATIMS